VSVFVCDMDRGNTSTGLLLQSGDMDVGEGKIVLRHFCMTIFHKIWQ